MAKDNKTFASRAKALIKQYSRADFDSIEKKELESSLQQLQEEQESYKQDNGVGEYSPEMKNGGNMYDGVSGTSNLQILNGGNYLSNNYLPGFNLNTSGIDSQINGAADLDQIYGTKTSSGTIGSRESLAALPNVQSKSGVIDSTYQPEGLAKESTDSIINNSTGQQGEFSPYGSSIAPQLISGAVSGIGNLLMAKNAKDSLPRVNLQRASAPEVSYAPGRAAAERAAAKGSSQAKYASSRASRTRGEYLESAGAREAQISGQLGETLSKSHQEEALINANLKAGMNQKNAELSAKEQIFNAQQAEKEQQSKEQYTSAAISAIPQMTRDISQQRQQEQLINSLGQDYGWYNYNDPNSKWYQKKRKVIGYKGTNGTQLAKGY